MKLKRLYKKTQSNKVAYLDLYTRKETGKDICIMYAKTGTIGSDKFSVSSVKVTKGKNIGRKNETTPQQQAEKELISKWNLMFAKGYKDKMTYVDSSTNNTFKDKSIMPMLLNKYKPKKDNFKSGYIQFKKDGCRCIAEKHNGVIRLKSREGKIFNIPHILESITKMMNTQLDQVFDGELYLHGVPLQEIGSMVKRNDPNNKLEYHIYDIAIPNLTFTQRRNLLLALDVTKFPNIVIDYGKTVKKEKDVILFHKKALDMGYEGSVFCDPNSKYGFGFRTSGKTKLKPRVTDEFECIDHYWNKGKMKKQSTLICRTKEGKVFHVKLKGTSEQREKWASNFETDVKGKMITVEYRKLSNDKKPLEAVGIAIRDYE